jgi:hypothetical protein
MPSADPVVVKGHTQQDSREATLGGLVPGGRKKYDPTQTDRIILGAEIASPDYARR